MEKIWIRHYPKGIPAEIDVNEYASVREIFEESASKYGGRPAFTCMGRSVGFSELDTLSAAFGACHNTGPLRPRCSCLLSDHHTLLLYGLSRVVV